MSVTLDIPASETGILRVFSLSMTAEDAKALRGNSDALSSALGAPVDPAHIEVFALSDLEGVGLPGYLAEGNGIPDEQLNPDRAKLEILDGWVLIARSKAFDGPATLAPVPALTLIGTYGETQTDWRATQTVESDAAKPYSAPVETVKKKPSDAAMSGRIATVVLVLLGLLTWAIIWIAG